jgi:hypothetical protein
MSILLLAAGALVYWHCSKQASSAPPPETKECVAGACLTDAIRTGTAGKATYPIAAGVPITVETEVFASAGDSTRLRMRVVSDSSGAGLAGKEMDCTVPKSAVNGRLPGDLDTYCKGSLADAIMQGIAP